MKVVTYELDHVAAKWAAEALMDKAYALGDQYRNKGFDTKEQRERVTQSLGALVIMAATFHYQATGENFAPYLTRELLGCTEEVKT